jgi:hypothetical protein
MSTNLTERQVFINYYKEDVSYASRLYSDLRAANLNPWIDKEDILPGQYTMDATMKAIKESDYFVALLSKISVNVRGDVQLQITTALEVLKGVPESRIYFIPSRLDDVDIPYKLSNIHYVDLFPIWEEGLTKILKAINLDQKQIESVIQHQRINSPFTSSDISPGTSQAQTFKGEKQFFVGRQNYIDQIIKDKLIVPGSKVSIVGPGGAGKSQLAFKAIHEYIKEDLFDLVIPIYFGERLTQFDEFLLQQAEILGLKPDSFERNNMEERKNILRDLLNKRKHSLIYLDNFETVSLILNMEIGNNENREIKQNSRKIIDFLDNVIPANNTSVLVTSRERKNNLFNEEPIDLEGLDIEDSMRLFNGFVRPIFKDPKGNTKDQVEEILKKTGGHPLSIEIIAKNIRSVRDLEKISHGGLKGDPTQAEERFQTLKACFDYTINKLDDKLQKLLPKLTLFKSPFPISAPIEILDANENEILDLYDRSLLTLIDSDERYGRIQDPDYWLYNFHPAIRGYVEDKRREDTRYDDLKQKFSKYYFNVLSKIKKDKRREDTRYDDFLPRIRVIQ